LELGKSGDQSEKMPEKSIKKAVQTEPISNIGTKKNYLVLLQLTEKTLLAQHVVTLCVIIRQIILTQTVIHNSKLCKSFCAKQWSKFSARTS
jgi:hypothetical protein